MGSVAGVLDYSQGGLQKVTLSNSWGWGVLQVGVLDIYKMDSRK